MKWMKALVVETNYKYPRGNASGRIDSFLMTCQAREEYN
jgi:hypothetical protein